MVRLAVIGDPVEHSLSPKMQTAALSALGIDGTYEAIRASANEFKQTILELKDNGYLGVNVTIPHKASAAQIADEVDESVSATTVANTLKLVTHIQARNTDIPGFLRPIQHLKPATALVLGAGGAGAAAVYALSFAGWKVKVWNRTKQRVTGLSTIARDVTIIDEPNPSSCTLVVNTTPLGLQAGEMPPLLWEHLSATVYDLPYRDGPTDFLQKAASLGNPTFDGREMLVEQGALSLEWWLDIEAPRDVMRKAVGL